MSRILTLIVLVPLLTGCLEREERITVLIDGTVDVVHRWKGDPQDLAGGAARLPAGPVWQVERRTETADDGKQEETLVARATFASAAAVPTRFGAERDHLAPQALTFTTSLAIDRAGPRTVYTFRRSYGARPWAEERHLHRKFLGDIEELERQGPAELDQKERRTLVDGLVGHERAVMQHQGEQVVVHLYPTAHPRARLAVREAVGKAVDVVLDTDRALALLDLPEAEVNRFIAALHLAVDAAIVRAVGEALGAGATETKIRSVLAALRHGREVTQDLEDERFVVRLRLPGKVLHHNADQVVGQVLVWKFEGKDLRDRRHELLAISAVEG